MIEVRLLGPVEIAGGDDPARLHGAKQRTVLAVLALAAGRVVPVSRLVDAVWADAPPATAHRQVLNAVSGLRCALGPAIVTTPAGYLLDPDLARTDLGRFEAARAAAGRATAAGQPRRAAELLAAALAMWRGPALGGVTRLAAAATRLEELRLAAVEDRVEAELDGGAAAELLGELATLAAAHPLRERLQAQLMLARYRAGRQAEALAGYHTARRALRAELGLEPGPELRRLEHAILTGDPALVLPAPPAAAATARPPTPGPAGPATPAVPAQLPADVAAFIGREAQLGRLDALLTPAAGPDAAPRRVTIVAVTGMAGAGKTALAVHWAHRMRDRFPDGQLYLDLRGYDRGVPLRPIEALAGLLPGLGVPREHVATNEVEAAGLYRTLLADRRVLIVLDNARHADQVRPLLPGGAGCLVLVTSRERLTGLVARDGAHRVVVDALTPSESGALLTFVVGADRVAAEPAATAELAELCSHLPLALRIAAADLHNHPGRSLAQHAALLRAGDRLTALGVDGDPHAAVRVAFDLSYGALPEPAGRMFRLLGLAPGPDITAAAAAALADTSEPAAGRLLGQLAAAHLVHERLADRYGVHDLLRLYAAERAGQHDGPAERTAAVERLLDWYLHRADAAARLLYPQIARLDIGPAARPGPGFESVAAALSWLEGERPALVDAIKHAARCGPRPAAWRLADTLRGYFWHGRYTVDWVTAAQAGLAAATADDHPAAQAALHLSLGTAERSEDRYAGAVRHYVTAQAYAERAGWLDGQAVIIASLGCVHANRGDLAPAIECHTRAKALAGRTGARVREAVALVNLGWARQQLGDLTGAEADLTEGLRLHEATDSLAGAAIALDNLAEVSRLRGRLELAEAQFQRAGELHRQFGSRYGETQVLHGLAAVRRDGEQAAEALELATAALQLARSIRDRRIETSILITMAASHLSLGRVEPALTHYRLGLRQAREIGACYLETAATLGVATVYREIHRYGKGVAHARHAHQVAHAAGYQLLEAEALAVMSALDLATDHADRAAELARQALAIQQNTGHRLGQAHALIALAGALTGRVGPNATGDFASPWADPTHCIGRAREILDEYRADTRPLRAEATLAAATAARG